MREKKLQVFVSSTYTDLIEERQAAVASILSSGHIPAGMELFNAGDQSQMTVIERWIDESDIYLLILGGRYGSIDQKSGKSYTHLEYEYAISKNKPLFAVVISDKGLDDKVRKAGKDVLEQADTVKLTDFRTLVTSNLVKFWDDPKDIKITIAETLADLSFKEELTGWIRGDKAVNTGLLAQELATLSKENQLLRNKLLETDPSSTLLYSGLTFTELSSELNKLKLIVSGEEITVAKLLIEIGNRLAGVGLITGNIDAKLREVLVRYRIITDARPGLYRFTEDGHKFFLRLTIS